MSGSTGHGLRRPPWPFWPLKEGEESPATSSYLRFLRFWGCRVLRVPHLCQWLLGGLTGGGKGPGELMVGQRSCWPAPGESPGKARDAQGAHLVKQWGLKGETIFRSSRIPVLPVGDNISVPLQGSVSIKQYSHDVCGC